MRLLLTIYLLLCGTAFADAESAGSRVNAESDIGIAWYYVPIVEEHISAKAIAQEILRASRSRVTLPENYPDHRIKVNRTFTRLTLTGWNLALRKQGIRLSMSDQALGVRVNEALIQANLDEIEANVCNLFGIERNEANLIHHSSEGSRGPVVVLLHGLDSGQREFGGTCEYLDSLGYDMYFFEYPNDDRIQRNAERLSAALKALPADRRRDISIVTISMGGLISQTMIENDELFVPGIRRFIACVPPFKGSELAKFRGVNELGDLFENAVFQGKFQSPFSDGMGLAGYDLRPDSVHLQKLAAGQRRAGVRYSILAGDKGIVPAKSVRLIRDSLKKKKDIGPVDSTMRMLMLEQLDDMLKFTDGVGDGAVALESAVLENVTDREVLHFHHLEFLTGTKPGPEIPALQQVLERLPPVKAAPEVH